MYKSPRVILKMPASNGLIKNEEFERKRVSILKDLKTVYETVSMPLLKCLCNMHTVIYLVTSYSR